MRAQTQSFCLSKIRYAIIGLGLGAGLGVIGVAIMAIRATASERLAEQALLLLQGGAVGFAMGWLAGSPFRARELAQSPSATSGWHRGVGAN